ncbi:MAG: alkene reductase [Gemmatimonadales bacterium]
MHANGIGRLFSPVRLGRLVLPNRIVMAPMTRSRASAGGVPGPLAATYYAQRASAGLIISEAAHVAPEGIGYPNTPGIHSDRQLAGWRGITRAVHAEGGRIFLQLWHVGRISHPCMQPGGALPVAPSSVAPDGQLFTAAGMQRFVTPRALEIDEIPVVVDQFARAARMARDAEFDGVDIHAANGYLLDQFLRDGSNLRTDGYGGSIANRARFLLEVTEAVSGVWGADRVGVRLSPLSQYNSMRDSNPTSTFSYVAGALRHLGIGYLHVAEPGPGHPMATSAGCRLLAGLRAAFPECFVVDGGRDRQSAEAAVTAADADLVALATPFISNPDLVERLAHGISLVPADPKTFYAGGERGYTDYPACAPLHGDASTHAVMNG